MIQSLIVTCRLHSVDPYTYLIDVLQRIAEHPASRVTKHTPDCGSSTSPPNQCSPTCIDFQSETKTLAGYRLQRKFN